MDSVTVRVVVFLGLAFLVWYAAGNELMRRRGSRLAIWCKRTADAMGGQQAIKWFTLHSFRLEVDQASAPLQSAALIGLTESWDVPIIWLWNRLNWRRDMVLAQLVLTQQPLWGLELYRPRALLADDARHAARLEGWDEEPLAEFRLAPATDASRELAVRLLSELQGQRDQLIRLSVRRRETHLSIALNVPRPEAFGPQAFHGLLGRLIATVNMN